MHLNKSVPFKITNMDSLGQGISKETDKITFIPKTLPEEEGEALIVAERKGVAFGQISIISRPSTLRTEAPCPHFSACPSCHYQHTSYDDELKFKKQSLEKLFYKIKRPEIEVIPAVRRFEYRNRIQLHYDLRKGTLGMLNASNGSLLPIPKCIIALPVIQDEIKRLYLNDRWKKEAPKVPKGHVEIYLLNGDLQVTWNRPYAEGGFTQVFQEMNELLKEKLVSWSFEKPQTDLLDLFAGNGNLSQNLSFGRRLCVDIYSKRPGTDFFSQNLYDDVALHKVQSEMKSRNFTPRTLILDPPRAGLKNLDKWIDVIAPEKVAYVSCDPHTLVRDLSQLKNYTISKCFLYDFFPATFHFETMVFLDRNN